MVEKMVTVEAIVTYRDMQKDELFDPGMRHCVTPMRANDLVDARLVKIIPEKEKADKKE